MPKIVHSNLAPSEPVSYSLAGTSFELDGSKKTSAYETDDATVLADARAHPWLDVEVAKADLVVGPPPERIDPKTDPLSAQHPDAALAFDADAARATLKEQFAEAPVAIQAGLDQDKKITAGEVAQTVAAADAAAAKVTKTSKETN